MLHSNSIARWNATRLQGLLNSQYAFVTRHIERLWPSGQADIVWLALFLNGVATCRYGACLRHLGH